MKIRIMALAGCLLAATALSAQKKEMDEAQGYLKSGKNLDKAEKLMTSLLAKPENRQNLKIYHLWYQTVEAQYEEANTKLYLKQKYDTTKFFSLVQHLFAVAETLDSVDARPDKKGRVRPSYRKRNAGQLSPLRSNLYYGGTYQMRKGDYEQAFGFLDSYIDTSRQPLFTGYDYEQRDTVMPDAAYWASTCAYLLQRPDSVLRYAGMAMTDPKRRETVMQYVCEAYRWQQNDSAYQASLKSGYEAFTENSYFFPRLADLLTAQGLHQEVLALAGDGLSKYPDNQLMLLAQSVALLHLERYDECLAASKHLIVLNDSMPEPYLNIGTVLLNQALEVEQENEPRKNHLRLQALYREAKPYMETFRKLAPDEPQQWAPGLYRIYLNLNMGKEFDEADRILRNLK